MNVLIPAWQNIFAESHSYPGLMGKVATLHTLLELGCMVYSFLDMDGKEFEQDTSFED